jgi:subtilase family serine protease
MKINSILSSIAMSLILALPLRGTDYHVLSSGNFSMDTADPVLSLNSPNGGESYHSGGELPVSWSASDDHFGDTPITLNISTQSGGDYAELAGNLSNSGSHTATAPNTITTEARLEIIAVDNFGNSSRDSSDAAFEITASSSLVAWYPFSGNANDESGNGNDGTVNGASLTTDRFGNANSAYGFDGVDDYIHIPEIDFIDNYAISCWVNLTDAGVYPQVLGSEFEISISIGSEQDQQNWEFLTGDGARWDEPRSYANSRPSLNMWHHLFINVNDKHVTYYLNNIPDGTKDVQNNASTDFYIGRRKGIDSNYAFQGFIDDIQIYNRSLSEVEVDSLYHLGGWDRATEPRVRIMAQSGAYQDLDNYAGTDSSATNGFDMGIDIPKPPSSPGDYVRVYFPHPEWNYPLGSDFAADYRSEIFLSDTMHIYEFRVKSTLAGELNLTFAPENLGDSELWLKNQSSGLITELDGSGSNTTSFTATANTVYRFELCLGHNAIPAATSELSASAGNSSITLSWPKSAEKDLSRYLIYEGNSADGLTLIDSVSVTGDALQSYQRSGLINGTRYYYQVKARDSFAQLSSGSNMVSALPNAMPLLAFSDASPFNSQSIFTPAEGTVNTEFEFEVFYQDDDNNEPANGYPRLELDANGDGDLNDPDDQTIVMYSLGGTDYLSGVRYAYSGTLPVSQDYQIRIVALDEWGGRAAENSLITQFSAGPDVYHALPDLRLISGNITISPTRPLVNEEFEIQARVENLSDANITNANVRFYWDGTLFHEETIPYVNQQSFASVSAYHTVSQEGVYPLSIVVDETNAIVEENEGNNSASIPVSVGEELIAGEIILTLTADPATLYPYNSFRLNGTAHYESTFSSALPVAGANVSITFNDQNYELYTDSDGNFSQRLYAPGTPNLYTADVEVTDLRLSASESAEITVIARPINEDGIDWVMGYISNDPLIPLANETSTVTATLSNGGTLTAPATKVWFYMDGQVADSVNISEMNAGASTALNFNASWPETGEHSVAMRVDPKNEAAEWSESNNYRSRSITVAPPQPDITVTHISFSNYSPYVNEMIQISATLLNRGGSDINGLLYLEFQYDGNLIGTASVDGLQQAQSKSASIYFRPTASGTHSVTVLADPGNAFAEADENNNRYSRSLNVQAPLPDLRAFAQDLSVSNPNPTVGEAIDAALTIHNGGNADAGAFQVQFKMDDLDVGSAINVSGLAAGAETSVSANDIWSAAAQGSYVLSAHIDEANSVSEANESNNSISRAIIVGDAPDLRIADGDLRVSDPYCDAGDSLNFSITVHNQGAVSASATVILFQLDEWGNSSELKRFLNVNTAPGDSSVLSGAVYVNAVPLTLEARALEVVPEEPERSNNSTQITIGDVPPILTGIPDIQFDEDQSYNLYLSDYTTDPGDALTDMRWAVEGNQSINVEFMGLDTIRISGDAHWFGTETLIFTVYDANDESDKDTMVVTIRSVNDAPLAFGLIAPTDTTLRDSTISFLWNRARDIEDDEIFYTLQLSQNRDFRQSIQIDDLSDTLYSGNLGLKEDISWFWRVQAEDTHRAKTFSDTIYSFVVDYLNHPPEKPIALAPADGAIIDSTAVFKWRSALDADINDTVSYTIQWNSSPSFSHSTMLHSVAGLGDTVCSASDFSQYFAENGKFYWRLAAIDTEGDSSGFTQSRAFYWNNIKEAPADLTLQSPVNEIILSKRPTYRWSASTDADPGSSLRYELKVFGEDNLSVTVTDTFYTVSSDQTENGLNYWQVRALDNDSLYSAWSDTAYYIINSINDAPESFTLKAPAIGDTVYTLKPQFSWHASIDGDPGDTVRYTLRLSEGLNFSEYSDYENISDTSYTFSENLKEDAKYYWRIKASDLYGKFVWSSDTGQFFINSYYEAPTMVALLSPAENAVLDSTAFFSWSIATDPDLGDSVHYVIEWSADTSAAYLFSRSTGVTELGIEAALKELLIENGRHWWRVKSVDNQDLSPGFTEWRSFYWNNAKESPELVTLVNPVDQVLQHRRPIYRWSASSDADPGSSLRYELKVFGEDNLSVTVTDTFYTVSSDQTENGLNYWQVRALDNDSLYSSWSDTAYYIINSINDAPGSFTLLYPAVADTVDTLQPTFRWSKAIDNEPGDTVKYSLHLSSNESFQQFSEYSNIADTLFYLPDTLDEDAYYWWKVKAFDLYGAIRWSESRSFLTNAVENVPPIAWWTYSDTLASGMTMLSYDGFDENGNAISYSIEFSANNGLEWRTASAGKADSTIKTLYHPWDSELDLPHFYGKVWLRVTPSDLYGAGVADTLILTLDNIPVSLSIAQISGEQRNDVTCSYIVNNDPLSPTTVMIMYRKNETDTWHVIPSAHFTPAPYYANGEEISVIWHSLEDLRGFVGSEVRLRVRATDASASVSIDSDPFTLVNNLPPSVTMNAFSGWHSDTVTVNWTATDPEGDALSHQLFYSTDGIAFFPASSSDSQSNQTVAGPKGIQEGKRQSAAVANGEQSTRSAEGKRSESSAKSSSQSTSNSSSQQSSGAASPNNAETNSKASTVLWFSKEDLSPNYAGIVWLRIDAWDAYSAHIRDTASVQIDNYRPELSFEMAAEEYSDYVSIPVTVVNDPFNATQIRGEANLGSGWLSTSIQGVLAAGAVEKTIIWNSKSDMPDGIDQNISLRLQAYDGQESGDWFIIENIHLDNNAVPVVNSVTLKDDLARGDVHFDLEIIDPEKDRLRFQFWYNTGGQNISTTNFSVDSLSASHYSLTWFSGKDLPGVYEQNTKIGVMPMDNDWGLLKYSSVFALNNRAGPKLTAVEGPLNGHILWQDSIKFSFDTPMKSDAIAQGIQLFVNQSEAPFSHRLQNNNQTIVIRPEQYSYQAESQYKIILNTQLTDQDGLEYDGNSNGIPDGVNDTSQHIIRTPMLGDYSRNGLFDADDILEFISAWNGSVPSLRYELAPALGSLPYQSFVPDGKLDFEDLMVFASMWRWAYNQSGKALAKSSLFEGAATEYRQDVQVIDAEHIRILWEIPVSDQTQLIFLKQSGLDTIKTELSGHWADDYGEILTLESGDGYYLAPLSPQNHQSGATTLHVESIVSRNSELSLMFSAWDSSAAEPQKQLMEKYIDLRDYIPAEFSLSQNYPNPFNPVTTIDYAIPDITDYALRIYDIQGRLVKQWRYQNALPGYYSFTWNGRNNNGEQLSSGIYFYQILAPNYIKTKKMVLVK